MNLTLSETPKTGFLTTKPICFHLHCLSTLILSKFYCPKKVVIFFRLLHIFKCTSGSIFIVEANITNPDQTAPWEQSDLGPNCLCIFKCTSGLIFIVEANTMNPDQTAPWEQSDLGPYCL